MSENQNTYIEEKVEEILYIFQGNEEGAPRVSEQTKEKLRQMFRKRTEAGQKAMEAWDKLFQQGRRSEEGQEDEND